jgi:hypothetical protein
MLKQGITALLLAATSIVSGNAQARQSRTADSDMAEIQAYRLTVPAMQKVTTAMKAIAQAMQNDPKYREIAAAKRELKALQQKDEPTEADEQKMTALQEQVEKLEAVNTIDMGKNETLSDMEKNIAKVPQFAAALQSAGLTPREYAKFQLAVLQAGFAAAMKKAGQLKELPAGVSPENVQFMIDHEAEFAALGKAMEGVGKN